MQGEAPSQELEADWQRTNDLEQRRKNERRIREEVRVHFSKQNKIQFY